MIEIKTKDTVREECRARQVRGERTRQAENNVREEREQDWRSGGKPTKEVSQ